MDEADERGVATVEEDAALEVPAQFVVDSDEAANWVTRKITEARAYARRCEEWCEREKVRAKRTEDFFLWRFGSQLVQWAGARIAEQGGRRKSVNLPAGTLGFRHEPPKIIVDDEAAVVEWCKKHHPELLIVVAKVSKANLNDHIQSSGEMPDRGVHMEPEREKFFVR
jgi:phage host-nuclease inhibitor protein Gam